MVRQDVSPFKYEGKKSLRRGLEEYYLQHSFNVIIDYINHLYNPIKHTPCSTSCQTVGVNIVPPVLPFSCPPPHTHTLSTCSNVLRLVRLSLQPCVASLIELPVDNSLLYGHMPEGSQSG